ncbi:MAG: SDR family oxidoreductase [Deltaproteobacteria bacterium]|nr:MAG: SDR family oxidoreductase [Deltaproteobacteria bacterium]
MNRLQDRVALITGATGGIGAETARRFLAEGAAVFLVDLEESALQDLASDLGDRVAFQRGDVSSEADMQSCVQSCVERFGGLHVYVANAGTEGKLAPLVQTSDEDFRRVIDVNLMGVFYGVKHAAPAILQAGGGSIVITSSVAGFVGSPGLGPYCSSKHAVNGLMKTAAQELGPQGVRVNTVNPGPVDNRMMRSIEDQAAPGAGDTVKEKFSAMVPLGRYSTNEEIAAMVTFLASEDSSGCNGTSYVVDGGMLSV